MEGDETQFLFFTAMTWIKLVALIAGLWGILVAPLPVLVGATVLLLPTVFYISKHRLLHVVPFWALLALPIALGKPDRAVLYALRSLDSLLWVGVGLAIWTSNDYRKVLSVLPSTLRWVVLLILKHATVFQSRLSRSTAALRLRWGRPSPHHYGPVFRGLIQLLDQKARRITFALKLREFE